MTRVGLVGGGAREHAMARALRRGGAEIQAVLQNPNPGIMNLADGHAHIAENDVRAVTDWLVGRGVDVVVVGPEAPLAAGLTDALLAQGLAVASPTQAAARIETDKDWMRRLMLRHEIPGRLAHHKFSGAAEAADFLDKKGAAWAIKPTGLTGGKGVQIYGDHFNDVAGAKAYVNRVLATPGAALQFEELAVGEEVTVMAFADGKTIIPMPAIQDHKRLREGDSGPNTGGMGSYSQADGLLPFLPREEYNQAVQIVQALVDALAAEGCPYRGTIYGQFMLTSEGPKVIEVNARFGDPEAMNALHTLDAEYAQLLLAMAHGTLDGMEHDVESISTPRGGKTGMEAHAKWRAKATVVKYCVPLGYGDGTPQSGVDLFVDDAALAASGASIYWANVKLHGTLIQTGTSRTLAVLGEGATIAEAETVCERGLGAISSAGLFIRHDIGTRALVDARIKHMQQLRMVTV